MIYSLALTKVTTTDDAAPTGTPASSFIIPDHHDRPGKMPTAALAMFVEFLDAGSTEIAGASCSARLWLQDQRSAKWYRVDSKKPVSGRSAVAFVFPPLNGDARAYVQITDVSGTDVASIRAYVAETAAMLPTDPATGALRVADVLQRGGEQNALGVHRTSEAYHSSPDGAPAWAESVAFGKSIIAKAAPGNLFGGYVAALPAATLHYLMFFDGTAVPANGAVPKLAPIPLPAAQTRVDLPAIPRRYFPTGIVAAASSTQATLTLTANDHYWFALADA
jgi:hypothetical protein